MNPFCLTTIYCRIEARIVKSVYVGGDLVSECIRGMILNYKQKNTEH